MSAFGSAFAAARKAGKKTFTWNGNLYTTQLASETSPPKNPPVPQSRPNADPDAPAASSKPAGATKTPEKQGPKPEGVWYAAKGSPMSIGAARRDNAPSTTPPPDPATAKGQPNGTVTMSMGK